MSALKADCLSKNYKKNRVLSRVTLEVKKGEVVSLLGPNGAGKTTTFYIICGLIAPDEGKVWLEDSDVTALPLHKKARLGIAYLPQESSIFKDLTVEENVHLACEAVYQDKNAVRKRVEELLEALNIEPIRTRDGYKLSGGERRRVEIARALAVKPKFILLDEPFAGVDPIAVFDIQNIIRELSRSGIGVLITDHNYKEALEVSDKAYVLKDGEVLESGEPAAIYNSELVKKYYLGERAS